MKTWPTAMMPLTTRTQKFSVLNRYLWRIWRCHSRWFELGTKILYFFVKFELLACLVISFFELILNPKYVHFKNDLIILCDWSRTTGCDFSDMSLSSLNKCNQNPMLSICELHSDAGLCKRCYRVNDLTPFYHCRCAGAYLLTARQQVAKFNEVAKNTLNVYMALFRVPEFETDILMTLNDPTNIRWEDTVFIFGKIGI